MASDMASDSPYYRTFDASGSLGRVGSDKKSKRRKNCNTGFTHHFYVFYGKRTAPKN
jgi:hypothetical protein